MILIRLTADSQKICRNEINWMRYFLFIHRMHG